MGNKIKEVVKEEYEKILSKSKKQKKAIWDSEQMVKF